MRCVSIQIQSRIYLTNKLPSNLPVRYCACCVGRSCAACLYSSRCSCKLCRIISIAVVYTRMLATASVKAGSISPCFVVRTCLVLNFLYIQSNISDRNFINCSFISSNGCTCSTSIPSIEGQSTITSVYCVNFVRFNVINRSKANIITCYKTMGVSTNRICDRFIVLRQGECPCNCIIGSIKFLWWDDVSNRTRLILSKWYTLKSFCSQSNRTKVGVRVSDRLVTTTQSNEVISKTNSKDRNCLDDRIIGAFYVEVSI